MTAYQHWTVNFATNGRLEQLFFTPELVLCLCQVLAIDDADIIVFSQVCKRLNTLALHTLFIGHGIAPTGPGIASGMFSLSSLLFDSLSSSSHKDLLHLRYRSYQIRHNFLRHVLSKLLPIPEWIIITTHTIGLERPHQLVRACSQLLFTIYPYHNLSFSEVAVSYYRNTAVWYYHRTV